MHTDKTHMYGFKGTRRVVCRRDVRRRMGDLGPQQCSASSSLFVLTEGARDIVEGVALADTKFAQEVLVMRGRRWER